MQQDTSPLKETTSNTISQLYSEFTTLRNIIDSSRKFKKSVNDSSHSKRSHKSKNKSDKLQNKQINYSLLKTPQPTYFRASSEQKQNENSSGLLEINDSAHQERSSNRKQLIEEYSLYYEYSIKRVMRCRERSGKKKGEEVENQENQENQQNLEKIGKVVSKRLLFDQQHSEEKQGGQQMQDQGQNNQFKQLQIQDELQLQQQRQSHDDNHAMDDFTSIFDQFQLQLNTTLTTFSNRLSTVNTNLFTIQSHLPNHLRHPQKAQTQSKIIRNTYESSSQMMDIENVTGQQIYNIDTQSEEQF